MPEIYDKYPNLEFYPCSQGSDEWFLERQVGSSDIKKAFAGGQGKTRTSLMQQKVRERHSGEFVRGIETADMRWGTMMEPEARQWFEAMTGLQVVQIGLFKNKKYNGFHDSPDGLIFTTDGIYWLEIKCPKYSTHLKYVGLSIGDSWLYPTEYRQQIEHHGIMLGDHCAGGFFLSYFPEKKGLEISEEAQWAQVFKYVPPPSAAVTAAHVANMDKWNSDYLEMSMKAEKLVMDHRQEQQRKADNLSAAIMSAAANTNELIGRLQ